MKPLTNRQKQVVRLTSLGLTIEQVAHVLGVSRNTVDNHRSRAMEKLDIRRIPVLVRYAIKSGISPLDDELTEEEERVLSSEAASDA